MSRIKPCADDVRRPRYFIEQNHCVVSRLRPVLADRQKTSDEARSVCVENLHDVPTVGVGDDEGIGACRERVAGNLERLTEGQETLVANGIRVGMSGAEQSERYQHSERLHFAHCEDSLPVDAGEVIP